jgi:hypothetical protein
MEIGEEDDTPDPYDVQMMELLGGFRELQLQVLWYD